MGSQRKKPSEKLLTSYCRRIIRKISKAFENIWSAIIVGRANWFIREKTARLLSSFRAGAWTGISGDNLHQFWKPTLTSPGANMQRNNNWHSTNLLECST